MNVFYENRLKDFKEDFSVYKIDGEDHICISGSFNPEGYILKDAKNVSRLKDDETTAKQSDDNIKTDSVKFVKPIDYKKTFLLDNKNGKRVIPDKTLANDFNYELMQTATSNKKFEYRLTDFENNEFQIGLKLGDKTVWSEKSLTFPEVKKSVNYQMNRDPEVRFSDDVGRYHNTPGLLVGTLHNDDVQKELSLEYLKHAADSPSKKYRDSLYDGKIRIYQDKIKIKANYCEYTDAQGNDASFYEKVYTINPENGETTLNRYGDAAVQRGEDSDLLWLIEHEMHNVVKKESDVPVTGKDLGKLYRDVLTCPSDRFTIDKSRITINNDRVQINDNLSSGSAYINGMKFYYDYNSRDKICECRTASGIPMPQTVSDAIMAEINPSRKSKIRDKVIDPPSSTKPKEVNEFSDSRNDYAVGTLKEDQSSLIKAKRTTTRQIDKKNNENIDLKPQSPNLELHIIFHSSEESRSHTNGKFAIQNNNGNISNYNFSTNGKKSYVYQNNTKNPASSDIQNNPDIKLLMREEHYSHHLRNLNISKDGTITGTCGPKNDKENWLNISGKCNFETGKIEDLCFKNGTFVKELPPEIKYAVTEKCNAKRTQSDIKTKHASLCFQQSEEIGNKKSEIEI